MRRHEQTDPGRLKVERLPTDETLALVRLFDNVVQVEDGFEFDEYELTTAWYPGLDVDVEGNLTAWLADAKTEEEERETIPRMRARIAELEAEKAALERDLSDTQLALCDVYEMIGGGG